jgi:ABC-type proline/glycine betaine transport system ATPase subunit
MPTHSPPTPADEYLSTFVRHFNNISLLNTKAHPPPSGRNTYELRCKNQQKKLPSATFKFDKALVKFTQTHNNEGFITAYMMPLSI